MTVTNISSGESSAKMCVMMSMLFFLSYLCGVERAQRPTPCKENAGMKARGLGLSHAAGSHLTASMKPKGQEVRTRQA